MRKIEAVFKTILIIIGCINMSIVLFFVFHFSSLFLKTKLLDRRLDNYEALAKSEIINYLEEKYDKSFRAELTKKDWYEDKGGSGFFNWSLLDRIDDSIVKFNYIYDVFDSNNTKFKVFYEKPYKDLKSNDFNIDDDYFAASISKKIESFINLYSLKYHTGFSSHNCDNTVPDEFYSTDDAFCENNLDFFLYTDDVNVLKSLTEKINNYLYGDDGVVNDKYYKKNGKDISINYSLTIFKDEALFDRFNSHNSDIPFFYPYQYRQLISKKYLDFELMNYKNDDYDIILYEFSAYRKDNMWSHVVGYKKR